MAKFDIAIPKVLAWEGRYINHPNDPGGETMRGITDKLDGRIDHMVDVDGDGYPDVDIKNLTVDQAKEIYKREFWDKMMGDWIESQAMADIVFDGYVNCWKNGIRLLQDILNVDIDGHLGPRTLQVLNLCEETAVHRKYKQARIDYYNNLADRKPELEVFRKGWLNRINSFPDI